MQPNVISTLVLPAGRDAGSPCLTYLDPASGERTELSGRAVALWVAKIANLVQDELGLEPGDVVALRLPAHWQAWTWLLGAWLAGCVVDVNELRDGGALPGDADVAVVPLAALVADSGAPPNSAVPLVSLALRPMALPGPPPPAGVLDFDTAVRGHGDRYTARPGVPTGRLRVGGRDVAWTDLLDAAPPSESADHDRPGRLLTTLAPTGLEAVTAVVRALAAGSGVVLLAPGPAAGTGSDRAAWADAATKALAGEGITRSTPECRDLLT